MVDYAVLSEWLKIPFGYKTLVKEIQTNSVNIYQDRLNEYCNLKQSLGLGDLPEFNSMEKVRDEQFAIQNTSYFTQAQYLGKIAKDSPDHLKPFLFHYAEISLYAFFLHSVFNYTGSNGHGLQIQWGNNADNTKLKIHKHGLFARILDAYWVLEADTNFSPIIYGKAKESVKNESEYSIINEPVLSLEQLLDLNKIQNQQGTNGQFIDAIHFLLLFYASSLSRYKPSYWYEIKSGQRGTEIIDFNHCFDRFDLLLIRLTKTLLDLCGRHNATMLQFSDPITENYAKNLWGFGVV